VKRPIDGRSAFKYPSPFRLLARALATVALVSACSSLNRSGPDVTCADLRNGVENACAQGIVATCSGGRVGWRVCDDKSACEASWQTNGRYRCAQSDPLPSQPALSAGGGSGGNPEGGTGGASSTGASGVGCDSCVSSRCSRQLSSCLGDSKCALLHQCITGCADTTCSSSCPFQYPSYDFGQPLRQCVSGNCSKECPLWR
jgi:hypothetical protein